MIKKKSGFVGGASVTSYELTEEELRELLEAGRIVEGDVTKSDRYEDFKKWLATMEAKQDEKES